MKNIYNSSNVIFEFDEKRHILFQKWIGFVESNEFKFAIDKTIDISRQYSINFIFSDTTEQNALSIKSIDYAAAIVPELIKRGMKKLAFVVSKNRGIQAGLGRFEYMASSPTVSFFENKQEAMEWLMRIEEEKLSEQKFTFKKLFFK